MPEPRTLNHVIRGAASPRLILMLLLLAAGTLLTLVPGVDKSFEALFYDPQHGFAARSDPVVTALRTSTGVAAYGAGLFLLFALPWRVVLGRPLWDLSRANVVYLLAAFLLGPGLLANGVLKEHWGRARPSQIVEFGGDKHYTPPLVIADQCEHNCSFVSGEASLGFAFGAFGFAARTRRRRRLGFAVGVGLGSAFGLLRMAQGGHFLSDVFFAGLFMFLLAWLLHLALVERGLLDRLGLWPREPEAP